MSRASAAGRHLPAGIWVLGFGSLLMDISSEMIHSLLPVFMVTTLGASMVTVGVIEGVANASAALLKLFSGALSDYLGKRKLVLVLGYALAAISKPLFPLAATVNAVLAARVLDRLGKGLRVAPRDALVAELTPPSLRGAAYGLRQALDSVGALLGPLLAVLLMYWLSNDIRAVMWVAVVPAVLTVVLLVLFVHEPERPAVQASAVPLRYLGAVRGLPWRLWLVVALGAVFTLARFSEAFLILRGGDVGLAAGELPWVLVVMSLCYALAAYPAGAAADRMSAHQLLLFGLLLLIAADLVLAAAASPLLVFAGSALWGLHMAFTQGLLAKLVADSATAELLGTAFGLFNLATGAALLLASVTAGALWHSFGPPATFLAGAGFSALAAILLVLAPRHRPAA